jgi:putative transposase
MYGRKHQAIVKYDYQDKSHILVYRGEEQICKAPLRDKVHPAAEILGNEEDQALLKDEIILKNSLKKRTVSGARDLLKDVVIPETQRQIENAGFDVKPEAGSRKPEKVKVIPLSDDAKARLQAEFEDKEREYDEMGRINWDDLANMPDMERYEKLLEYEVQGITIPKDEAGFMRYFEQTDQYLRHFNYFDDHKTKLMMMYQ